MKTLSIFWFRQDLRIADNPGLIEAARLGDVLPIYIWENNGAIGEASNVYLHHALQSLNQSLNGKLNIYQGSAETVIIQLLKKYSIAHIFWNRCYEPLRRKEDAIIMQNLKKLGVQCHTFNASYLWNPEEVLKEDGSYYKVFGAFKRKMWSVEPRKPLQKPAELCLIKDNHYSVSVDDLYLLPSHTWHEQLMTHWEVGEEAALRKLAHFMQKGLPGYKEGRDYPATSHTSMLSPHLHYGEISPHRIWESVSDIRPFIANGEDVDHFLSELTWREFSCYLLYHFPQLPTANFQKKFDAFPWQHCDKFLKAWQTGHTGFPLIDAGMRELWQTGYMHNRVRMVVASFLVKNLMIHWHAGRDWFSDCLIDADLANNSASWQWVAGSGVDAAPYFRIFNPTTQGEKFDSEGEYTKKYVPELRNIPSKYLFKPWEAPVNVLHAAGVRLGVNYPHPIVDLKATREAALQAYHSIQ